MKAAVYSTYGPPEVIQLADLDTPVPDDDEVLIHLHATTVSRVDSIFRSGQHSFARLATGIFKPKNPVLGTEVSGVVEAAGSNVTRFQAGDRVYGASIEGKGTHAEYICLPEDGPITHMPEGISFEEAAAVPYGALTALPFLRDNAELQAGQKILINGASGSVGSCAVQLARHFGAEVTGVCGTSNVEMVLGLGADRVIDYTKEDFTEQREAYDVIFDAVGKSSFPRSRKALKKGGIYMTTAIGLPILLQMVMTSMAGSKKALIAFTGLHPPEKKREDLEFIRELVEDESLKPMIDRLFPLDDIAKAHKHVDTGHKKGDVVITI